MTGSLGGVSPPAPIRPLAAVVLAAGLGQRLGGRPKATLQIGGVSLLEGLVCALRGSGVHQVGVVLGPYRERLLPLAGRCQIHALLHPRAHPSLIDSQRLALDAHQTHWSGHDLLLLPCDLPRLNACAMGVLLAAWRARPAEVQALRPVVAGVPGHPLLLSHQAAAQAAAMPRHLGVRDWLADHRHAVREWHTSQIAHTTDLDTPEDLATLATQLHPTPVAWPPNEDQGVPNV